MPHETMEDYKVIEEMYFDSYNPRDDLEKSLVEEIFNSHRFHQRSTHAVNECEAEIHNSGYMLKNWGDQNHVSLARFLRYQTTRANHLKRAVKAREDHRKNRFSETIKAETPDATPATKRPSAKSCASET